ncbi:T9SS type A sorting domain-containing protein [uncultured Spirosoma sp.]|uniref:T9SS type A sorting domain-containing protein n=1 Tax=uncultured Spirosoma sp. TaxID=278208 RepID=UPI00259003D7|nr:T9SS type A sorting domain-containing protein [uncultured Spirosoma sp.]
MRKLLLAILLLAAPLFTHAQTEEVITRVSVTTSEKTDQDFRPWLNDDVNDLIPKAWQGNMKYIEVTLKLGKTCKITRLSLYDYEDVFINQPAELYALSGTRKTLIGKFEGRDYMRWVEMKPSTPLQADAIVVRKFGNNFPQKIKVFGIAVATSTPVSSTPVVTTPPASTTTATTTPIASTTGATATQSPKIPIEAARWYQVNNTTNGLDGLFDGRIDQPVNTGWGKILTNYDAYYPLNPGETMVIDRIRFYDGQGTNEDAPLTLSVITDDWKRVPIAQFIGTQYNAWVGPNPSQQSDFSVKTTVRNARYLVINTSGAYPNELELYGSYIAPVSALRAAARVSASPLVQQFGVNAFEWNVEDASSPWQVDESSVKAVKNFSAIRHYMDWEKLESTQGEYTFNPTLSGSWNYDAIYERMKAENVDVLACLKTIPKWMENTYPAGQRDYENIPTVYGRDLSAPASYIEQAKVAFQYMARYGHNKNIDPSLVKVSSVKTWAGVNTVKIGLGLINYIECDNERDKTWKGRQAYQSAREYAANLSAFYDGHKNTLGVGVGAKNADPSVKVVIGGIASSSTDYLRAMIDWCKEFRGYKADGSVNLCWDVINQHLYSNDAKSSQNGGGSRGAAPELSGTGEQAAAFVAIGQQYNLPVWITEAGYDQNQGSPFRAMPIGTKTVEQTQADWILRTALMYSRVGIDRLFFYQMHDDNAAIPVQFYSMGLINDNKTRKPAADYLYQVKNLLGAYTYKETLNTDPLVDRYELTSNGQTRQAYMLVVPDEKGRTATYELSVGTGTVKLYTPKIGSDDMTVTTLMPGSTGKVKVAVSETPVFVLVTPASGARTAAEVIEPALGSLQVFPNPTTDYIELTIDNADSRPVTALLYDASTGRIHKQAAFEKPSQQLRERIDTSALPTGLYLLDVRQGADRAVRKVIKVQ